MFNFLKNIKNIMQLLIDCIKLKKQNLFPLLLFLQYMPFVIDKNGKYQIIINFDWRKENSVYLDLNEIELKELI